MSEMQKTGPRDEAGPHKNTAAGTDHTRDHGAVVTAVTGYALAVETGHDRYRRRLFLTLSAAENAVARARARGQYAEIVLVRIVPVEVIA